METFTTQMVLTSRHWKTTKLLTEQLLVSQVLKHGIPRRMELSLKLNAIFLEPVLKKRYTISLLTGYQYFSRSSLPITHTRSRPRSSPKVPMVQLLQLVTRSWLQTSAWSFQICIWMLVALPFPTSNGWRTWITSHLADLHGNSLKNKITQSWVSFTILGDRTSTESSVNFSI